MHVRASMFATILGGLMSISSVCGADSAAQLQQRSQAQPLPLQWTVGPAPTLEAQPQQLVPATVPGAVQYDWGRAQGWPDHWRGEEPQRYRGLEDQYWRYRATIPAFSLKTGERLLFTAEGVDYQFQILCGGRIVHEQEGMFTRAEVDLTGTAAPGSLLEVVVFPAPKMQGKGGRVFFESCKPGVSYGWDFHPQGLTPLGLWQEARLEVRPACDLRRVAVRTQVGDDLGAGAMTVTLTTSGATGQSATLVLLDAAGQPVWQHEERIRDDVQQVTADLAKPHLWWPHDQGTPYRYRLRVALAGEVIERHCAFRRVRLVANKGAETKPDGGTRPYAAATFEINGRRVFAKGANWVAPDIYYGLNDELTYRNLLTLVRDGNMNILRTWGGAPAPKEAFFEICDELGIMVSQEFPLAGGHFPGKPAWLRILDQESRSLIERIAQHPCLVQWCGGNELIVWSRNNEQQLMFRLLNRNCFELDPYTPFIASSPDFGIGHGPYQLHVGWTFLGKQRTGYAEFGAPGTASVETLRQIIPAEELFPPRVDGSWAAHHAKQWLQLATIEQIRGRQESLEQLVANSQMLQAEALRHAYEETRRQWPFCSQTLCWVLNEPWPSAANNSIIGWPCLPKPAYVAVKEACRPQLASARYKKVDWRGGEAFAAELWLLNDSPQPLSAGTLVAELRDGDRVLASTTWEFPEVPAQANHQGSEFKVELPKTAAQDVLTLALRVTGRPALDSAYRIFLPPSNPAPAREQPKNDRKKPVNAADPTDTPNP
jgi:beta-mannosidase